MGDISDNFDRSEFRCACCDFDTVDAELLRVLEKVRGHFNSPVRVTSGCRCKAHNAAVGGSENSQHLYGRAADIVVEGVEAAEVGDYAHNIGVSGVGTYDGFVHIDSRSSGLARW